MTRFSMETSPRSEDGGARDAAACGVAGRRRPIAGAPAAYLALFSNFSSSSLPRVTMTFRPSWADALPDMMRSISWSSISRICGRKPSRRPRDWAVVSTLSCLTRVCGGGGWGVWGVGRGWVGWGVAGGGAGVGGVGVWGGGGGAWGWGGGGGGGGGRGGGGGAGGGVGWWGGWAAEKKKIPVT